jgi:hypothetical protein
MIAKVIFHRCIQDSQDFGSDNEHMVSRIFLTLEINGQRYENLHADIKQPVGSSYEFDPIEVYPLKGYQGPLNYEAFRNAVEKYYRTLVGSTASGIRISGGLNFRMQNNIFDRPAIAEFQVSENDTAW